MTSKTALVFGWKGQDGSLITKSLLNQKFHVIGLSKQNSLNRNNKLSLTIEKDVQKENGDINDFDVISRLISKYMPDEIYNLAAQSSVSQSFSDPINTFNSILNGSLNILEVAKQTNYTGNIFFAGSSEMFGETEVSADINSEQKPVSPYAIAKQASFNLVKTYRELYNLKCVTGVLFNHESPLRDNKFVTHKIITEAIKCSSNKSYKLRLGNLEVSRDWGWAEEYVEAIQKITRAESLKDHVVCTGKLSKLKMFVEKTFNKLNLNWQDHVISDPNFFRKKDILVSYGNPSNLEKDLEWKAKIFLDEVIEKLIEDKLSFL